MDAVREVAHLGEHALQPFGDDRQPRADLRVLLRQRARELDLDPEGDEVLLCAVVQIALDPAPLGIGGGQRARP